MISYIRLEGYKCFPKAELAFAPLTLLAGVNSSGKSSVVQAIQMLKEGKLLEEHRKCIAINDKKAFLTIEFDNEKSVKAKIDVVEERKEKFVSINDWAPEETVQFISAERLGPRISQNLPTEKQEGVGRQGEYTLSVLRKLWDAGSEMQVPVSLRAPENPENSSPYRQIASWLEHITPGAVNLELKEVSEVDMAYSTFDGFRTVDVGFGLSYSLPIVVAVLNAVVEKEEKGRSSILVVENPEAHLHPHAQTEMGRFLAAAAALGVQIVIETHSDHLMNGIRLAVKEKKAATDDVIFWFFENDAREHVSKCHPIYIEEDGKLDNWPEGFFDEDEKNLLKLL